MNSPPNTQDAALLAQLQAAGAAHRLQRAPPQLAARLSRVYLESQAPRGAQPMRWPALVATAGFALTLLWPTGALQPGDPARDVLALAARHHVLAVPALPPAPAIAPALPSARPPPSTAAPAAPAATYAADSVAAAPVPAPPPGRATASVSVPTAVPERDADIGKWQLPTTAPSVPARALALPLAPISVSMHIPAVSLLAPTPIAPAIPAQHSDNAPGRSHSGRAAPLQHRILATPTSTYT